MNYALLALTATQIVIIAVCAFVGVALIATAAIAGIARSMKEKKHPAAPAAQEPAEQPAQPAEQTPEEESVPEEVKAEEVPVVEEPEEELPAPEEVKAEEVPVVETPEEAQAPADGTTRVIYTNDDGWYVNVRYDKSFEAKLIQGDEKLKNYYSELKNELLSYKKVTARKSWQHEAFRRGRTTVAKLVIRGKTLRLYLALEPMLYEESKYLVEDASEHAKFAKTPLLYRIKNDRRCRYAKDLIAAAMASSRLLLESSPVAAIQFSRARSPGIGQ